MLNQVTPEKPTDAEITSTPPKAVSEKNGSIEKIEREHVESTNQEDEELQPHLHARTFLAVFAVCLIYFAQDFALVGAGAVSYITSPSLSQIYSSSLLQ